MSLTLTYDATLSRVRISSSGLLGTPVTATIERSTNQVTWTTVRGGSGAAVSGGAVALDDYEFSSDVLNYYRVTAYDATPAQVDQQTASITPALDGVWLKSLARAYLNRKVVVVDYSDVQRSSRSGVFEVVGRSLPVAVTELHGSRRWTLEVLAQTAGEAADLDLLISTGEVQFIHCPASSRVPGGYVALGDASERRTARTSVRRVFSLPLTEVAAPGPDVVPAVGTWQTVLNTYATWADVLAAHPTWADLLELVGSPADVVVS